MVCILGAVLVELVSISIESLCLHSFFENFFLQLYILPAIGFILASYWLLIGFYSIIYYIQFFTLFSFFFLFFSLFFFF